MIKTTKIGNRYAISIARRLKLDLPLCLGILSCFCIGIATIYSANLNFILVQKQLKNFAIATIIMLFVAQFSPRDYRKWAPILYFSSLFVLLIVLIKGDMSKGAQRWLDLGLFRFQPSEVMKLVLPVMVVRYLDDHILPLHPKLLVIPFLYILFPVILIAYQPDLGTAILVASSGLFVLFFSGISWKIIIIAFTIVILSIPCLWMLLLDYQRIRILTLLNPESDPLGSGYHIIQSKIAIGSGGLFGKGWLGSTQSNLEFLPERTTDFIFAVFSEEFGFIGVLLLISIYLFILVRGIYISINACDTFSRLLSGSIIMTFFVYLFVNIGMVIGILPVVGLPLPLISYGGTSLVTLMIGFGILMSIHSKKPLIKR